MTWNAIGADPTIARVVELRQYTLRPGQREVLIELFERELIEPQEAVGMQVLGQFRDLDRPDRFVWLRGFSDMEARRQGLAEFYGGRVWATWGPAANATMIDSDDVLLLRPCGPGGLRPNVHPRPSPGASPDPRVLYATILTVDPAEAPMLAGRLSRDLEPALAEAGHRLLGCYETDPTPNNFPRLPVRTDAAFVWFTTSRHQPAETSPTTHSPKDRTQVAKALGQYGSLSWTHLRLAATSRSTLTANAATVRTSSRFAKNAAWER
jgi:NIPSNAP